MHKFLAEYRGALLPFLEDFKEQTKDQMVKTMNVAFRQGPIRIKRG